MRARESSVVQEITGNQAK